MGSKGITVFNRVSGVGGSSSREKRFCVAAIEISAHLEYMLHFRTEASALRFCLCTTYTLMKASITILR